MFGGQEIFAGFVAFVLVASLRPRDVRNLWRRIRRAFLSSRPSASSTAEAVLKRVRVIDGDTIQEMRTGVRYRIENIDAPETGERAKCFRERQAGEVAKQTARTIFERAGRIVARPIGRDDVYGRTVARIDVDGQDFGTIMIQKGLARPWGGEKEVWCGPKGGLAMLARARTAEWNCKTCAKWTNAGGAKAKFLPVAKTQPDRPVVAMSSDRRTAAPQTKG
ncbi:MAG: hypothetical protein GC155_09340 [Alphaproteobacteria bacterium]|nr:hypothetical protein [Alphaproteobacteria bacterium]